ncbi:MAG: hypothetical protein ACREGA_05150 [Candidatus Saccharimonadales bacterium]
MSAELSDCEINAVRQAVLEAGVWRVAGDFTFASGEQANNKLEIDRLLLPENGERRQTVVSALAKIAMAAKPDLLYGVPSGGQDFARLVGQKLDLPVISIDKILPQKPGQKNFGYSSDNDQKMVSTAARLVGIEDVTTTMTSLAAVLTLPGLAVKTQKMVAIWRRGQPNQERQLPLPAESLSWIIEQPIPNHIASDCEFYRAFGHQAVGRLTDIPS